MGAQSFATSLGALHPARTRANPMHGPGCWGREVSEGGIRRQEEDKEGEEGRKGMKIGEEIGKT